MTTELTAIDDGMNYIAALQNGEDAELAEFRAEANPFQIMPKLVLSKDTRELRAVQNDETIATFTKSKPLYFVPILISEHRALWAPGDSEDSQQPVCSTPRVPIGTFRRDADRGVGTWNVADNRDLPGPDGYEWESSEQQTQVRCAQCKWNKFKSMGEWDTTRDGSKGKACGEGRLIVGFMATKIGSIADNVGLFSYDPTSTMVYMNVPATSISAIHGIGNASVARRVPARYCVFALGNEPKKEGSMAWGVLTQEFSGFVDRPNVKDSDNKSADMREMVFVKDQTPDLNESSQSSDVIADEEVPF